MKSKIVNMRLNDIEWSQVENFEMYCNISMSDYAGSIYTFSIQCWNQEKKLNLEHIILDSLMIITDKTSLNRSNIEDIILRVKLDENDSIIDIGHLMCDIWLNDKIEDEIRNNNNDLLNVYIDAERKNYELINKIKDLANGKISQSNSIDYNAEINSEYKYDEENQVIYYSDYAELLIAHRKYGLIGVLIPLKNVNRALTKKWFYSRRITDSKVYHHVYYKQSDREVKINKLLFFKNGQPKDITENQDGPIKVNIRLDYRQLSR